MSEDQSCRAMKRVFADRMAVIYADGEFRASVVKVGRSYHRWRLWTVINGVTIADGISPNRLGAEGAWASAYLEFKEKARDRAEAAAEIQRGGGHVEA